MSAKFTAAPSVSAGTALAQYVMLGQMISLPRPTLTPNIAASRALVPLQ